MVRYSDAARLSLERLAGVHGKIALSLETRTPPGKAVVSYLVDRLRAAADELERCTK